MACGCRGGRRAGMTGSNGRILAGYQLTFPEGSGRPAETYSTSLEAKVARRESGVIGSTIEAIYQ